jgi:hypothetical protein
MIEIKRSDLYATKGLIEVSKNCENSDKVKVQNQELDKILAELLTRKYEGGNNANS